jgi:hypothetical protein
MRRLSLSLGAQKQMSSIEYLNSLIIRWRHVLLALALSLFVSTRESATLTCVSTPLSSARDAVTWENREIIIIIIIVIVVAVYK